jgi:hypothetical protein
MTLTVREIAIYPMKSGAARKSASARVTERGLDGDRVLMVTDEQGLFLTQREHPELALVEVDLDGDRLRLRVPNHETEVLIDGAGATVDVVVWTSRCRAHDVGDDAASLLSEHLGRKVRLVRLDPSFERLVNEKYARPGDQVSFADGYPLLAVTLASLADLNRRLTTTVTIDRFRPNLVIDGAEPFEEDGWSRLEIGDAMFDVAKPCARCVMVNVDQTTAERDPEVLKTLGKYRLDELGVIFGQNLIPRRLGTIRVGDEVRAFRSFQE